MAPKNSEGRGATRPLANAFTSQQNSGGDAEG